MADLDDILAKGGAQRIALLRYCVLSITMEPLFVFLVQEYRMRPGHAAALALFDVFCARQAPARLSAYELLPPRDLRVEAAIAPLRLQRMPLTAPEPPPADAALAAVIPVTAVTPATPARSLFDAIVSGLRTDTNGRLAQLSATYDPQRTPAQNLPGGRIDAAQRHFVDRVWQPIVRPQLVSAGFWQLATIG